MAINPQAGNIFSGSGIDPASALLGGNMFGSNNEGGFIMGALLGRLLFNQNGNGWDGNQNSDRGAISAEVAAQLASSNQANNNAMLLLKDIQDSSQDVIAAVNSAENSINSTVTNGQQTLLVNQLQNQIANLQGQGDIKTSVAAGQANIINEIHESNQDINNQLNTVNTNLLQGLNAVTREITADGDKTRALITANEIASLNRQLSDANNRVTELTLDGSSARRTRELEVNVTNNINQQQLQAQQQQQLNQLTSALSILAAQVNDTKQQVVTIGNNNRPTTTSTANNIA